MEGERCETWSFKPDMVAPGTSILSAKSRNAPVDTIYGASTDPNWMFDSGTSTSIPSSQSTRRCCGRPLDLVTNGISKPSAARIKALPINGANELAGQYIVHTERKSLSRQFSQFFGLKLN